MEMSPAMLTGVSVIRRPVRLVRLRVMENGAVELIVPMNFSARQVDEVIRRKAAWIERQRAFLRANPPLTASVQADGIVLLGKTYRFVRDSACGNEVVVDRDGCIIRSGWDLLEEQIRVQWYRAFARSFFSLRVAELSRAHGLPYRRLFVRSQRTRWGTCSSAGNISLNCRLILGPEYVIDYVILHELMHTKIPNHSKKFWASLSEICPRYKEARGWLKRNRPAVGS